MQQKVLFMASIAQFGDEFQTHIQDGWEIDPNHPLQPFGFGLEVGLLRDPTAQQLEDEAKPKRTRAEILAHARAVRAEKKAAAEEVQE